MPSASGQEVWKHHITATAKPEKLGDPRIARLLKVPEGSEVLVRHRVTGPEAEPPFQVNNSWIHPRVADIPGVAVAGTGPVPDWLYHIEKAGHGPLSWMEYHRARLPTKERGGRVADPVTMPVLEIVRVGRSASDGDPVEVTEYVIPSDRVETVHELHRDESAAWPWPEETPARATRTRSEFGAAPTTSGFPSRSSQFPPARRRRSRDVVRARRPRRPPGSALDRLVGSPASARLPDGVRAHDPAQAVGADQVAVAGKRGAQRQVGDQPGRASRKRTR